MCRVFDRLVTLRPELLWLYKRASTQSSILVLEGKLIHDSGVINLLVERVAASEHKPIETLSHDFY